MKAILRAIFFSAMIVLSMIVVVPLGIIVFWISYLRATNECNYYTLEYLPSPTDELAVARVEKRCAKDDDFPPMMFALVRPGERIEDKSVFLKSADYEGITSAYYRGIRSSLDIVAKWIDERNLLVAAPEGSTLKKGQNEFRDVHIRYSYYPMDSDKTKDEYQRRQVEKRVRFEPRFRMIGGIGVPGIGCQLDVAAYDGEYLDQLSLSIAARTSGYYFNIFARDEIHRKHATGADVVDFSPKDGRSTLMTYNVNYPGTPPKWDFGYKPKDPHDIMSIAEKIKDGTIAVQVGFWLDNEVVVYSGEKPNDQKPIEMFEQCIDENHIFDTPRHRTDRD